MRLPISAYTVLLTLVDDRKQFVTLQDREYLMEKLGDNLRLTAQRRYLHPVQQLPVPAYGNRASLENAWKVVERIRSNYGCITEKYSVYIGANVRPCCVRAEELRKCSGKEMKSKQENEWGKTEK